MKTTAEMVHYLLAKHFIQVILILLDLYYGINFSKPNRRLSPLQNSLANDNLSQKPPKQFPLWYLNFLFLLMSGHSLQSHFVMIRNDLNWKENSMPISLNQSKGIQTSIYSIKSKTFNRLKEGQFLWFPALSLLRKAWSNQISLTTDCCPSIKYKL